MKVALAHDHLFQVGGAERVLFELSQLFPQAPIYTLVHDRRIRLFEGRKIVTSQLQKAPFSRSQFKYYLPLMPGAWESFDFSDYDIVISSASAFAKGLIVPPGTTHISYCHSPTRYLWSDRVEYVESLHTLPIVKSYLRVLLSKLRVWDHIAAQRVDHYIANSHFIAERIRRYYNRDSVVIHPPIAYENFRASEVIGDYYLIISRLRPYKRVDVAIRAFNALRKPLVIIGDGEERRYLQKIAKDNITFLGEVSDKLRDKFLRECIALIHPQEEDFGITIPEAYASGRPVIAYGAGGALESVEDRLTGVLFKEQTWEELAETVIRFNSQEYNPRYLRSVAEQYSSSNFQDRFLTEIKSML